MSKSELSRLTSLASFDSLVACALTESRRNDTSLPAQSQLDVAADLLSIAAALDHSPALSQPPQPQQASGSSSPPQPAPVAQPQLPDWQRAAKSDRSARVLPAGVPLASAARTHTQKGSLSAQAQLVRQCRRQIGSGRARKSVDGAAVFALAQTLVANDPRLADFALSVYGRRNPGRGDESAAMRRHVVLANVTRDACGLSLTKYGQQCTPRIPKTTLEYLGALLEKQDPNGALLQAYCDLVRHVRVLLLPHIAPLPRARLTESP
eukprot:TRINITY_DN21768_c0_g1_i1.p2 TRINITY_DN21768_c0_g1~~TRINITY_DN21768_c0_g1_i1.p2  ORF type:complete len:265 (+),score=56.97 TRINITY_DN21768_c0_g1_i1:3-797(+)